MRASVLIRVLGPVDVVGDGGENLPLRGPLPARLLALLVASGGDVGVDDLAVQLWPHADRPADPVAALRTYVARLRSSLGSDAIITGTGSYRLGDVGIDAARFEELVERARRVSGSPAVADLWRQALDLWRGPAFGEHADSDTVRREANRLEELKAEATEAWFDARLAAGEGRELAADVETAIADHPLREGLRVQQMTVLARAGRQADALRAFQDFRADLTEVGLAPSPRLVDLDQQIAGGEVPAAGARRTLRGYELGDRLGEGAFAIVHQATQASLGRRVAIKQIRSSLADQPEFIRQFEAEARLVARLEHPHIVPLYDYWREPGSAYLVMRHVDGGSLAGRILSESLPLEQVAVLVGQVASGLAAAHDAGVVHRDVKPANILLDTSGNAYLSDFGIAVEEQSRLDPEVWLSHGSPAYAPPEQLRHEGVGPPADVYALAVTSYEALTGQLPFPTESTMAGLLERQLNHPIPLVRTSHPGVPAAVDSVLQKATAKNAANRHQTAQAFAADLAAAAGLEGDEALIVAEDRNPYKGLRAFDEADAKDFTGRDRLIVKLLRSVATHRVTAVVGPSGSGKSSVVRAGLLPALRNNGAPGSAQWFVTTMVPGQDPFTDLEAALLRVAVDPPADIAGELAADTSGLSKVLQRLLPDGQQVLLVIDQFEELFTLADNNVSQRFLDALVAATTIESPRLRIVVTIRADFYDRPLRHPTFARLIEGATVAVHPLEADELERVITEPARAVGVSFEPGLVAAIAADVADQPGALPLLQYALTELFDQRDTSTLTRASYIQLGGVGGAIGRRAETLFQSFDSNAQAATQRLMTRLVNFGDGTEDTRRRALRTELSTDTDTDTGTGTGTGTGTDTVLEAFGQARLLAFDRDAQTREPTVEVAHEALIREWPRLRNWLDDDRDGLRILRHLTSTATNWNNGTRPASELYRGGRLQAAEEWANHHSNQLNSTETAFLEASTNQHQAQIAAEAKTAQRLRRLLTGVAIIAVIAMVAGLVAFQQRARATEAAADAETRRLIADAANLREENLDLALLLAAEAYNRDPGPSGLAGLQRVLTETGPFLGRLGAGNEYASVSWAGAGIVGIGKNYLDIFNPRNSQRVRRIELEGAVQLDFWQRAQFDEKNGLFVTALQDGLVIADLTTGETTPVSWPVEITAIAFGPTTSELLIGDMDKQVTRYDLRTQRPVWTTIGFTENGPSDYDAPDDFDTHPMAEFLLRPDVVKAYFGSGVLGIASHPDGAQVLASSGGFIRSFDRETGNLIAETTPVGPVFGEPIRATLPDLSFFEEALVATSPTAIGFFDADLNQVETHRFNRGRADLNVLAQYSYLNQDLTATTLLNDGRISLSYESDPDPKFIDAGTGNATDMALSADGTTAAIATTDGLVLTALEGRQLLATAAPANGHELATTNPSGTIVTVSTLTPVGIGTSPTIYDFTTHPPSIRPSPSNLEGNVFFPGSDMVAIAGFDAASGGVAVADGRTFEPLLGFGREFEFGESVSNSGQTMTYGYGLELSFIDLERFEIIKTLDLSPWAAPEDTSLRQGDFSADDSVVAVTFASSRTVLIDTETYEVTLALAPDENGDGGAYTITYSQDGSLAVTRDRKGEIDVRDADTLEVLYRIEGGTGSLEELSYGPYISADNHYLLTTREKRARLWDMEAKIELGTFPSDEGRPPEGSGTGEQLQLVTILNDHVLKWNLDTSTWLQIACQAVGRNLTPEEWRQFGPSDQEHHATCPQWPVNT